MGIIIEDNIQLPNGLSVQKTYGCIAGNTLTITKRRTPIYEQSIDTPDTADTPDTPDTPDQLFSGYTNTYILCGRGCLWIDKEKRNNGHQRSSLKYEDISITYEDTAFLSSNPYSLLYTKWKENFTNVSDDV